MFVFVHQMLRYKAYAAGKEYTDAILCLKDVLAEAQQWDGSASPLVIDIRVKLILMDAKAGNVEKALEDVYKVNTSGVKS